MKTNLQIYKARRRVQKLRETRDAARAALIDAEQAAITSGGAAFQAALTAGECRAFHKITFIQASKKAAGIDEIRATYWATESTVERACTGTAALLTTFERKAFPGKGKRVDYFTAALA